MVMSKPFAADMVPIAEGLIGTPYSVLDCQGLCERCLSGIGINKNLPGSNAWYRAMDWVGTPEECRAKYGKVPTGAFLFIVEHDGGEPDKYKGDAIGNASHMGLVTNKGDGAIHSSASRGDVCQSKFKGKTIPRGGWNRVGLWLSRLSYDGIDQGDQDDQGGDDMTQAVVTAPNGLTVKMRREPSTGCAVYWNVPTGTIVDVSGTEGDWSCISYDGRTGWMLSKFLTAPGSDQGVTVAISRGLAEELLEALQAALN